MAELLVEEDLFFLLSFGIKYILGALFPNVKSLYVIILVI